MASTRPLGRFRRAAMRPTASPYLQTDVKIAVGEPERPARHWEVLLYILLAAAAAVASGVATRAGVGIDADSAAYLGTAQNIVDGRGITVPFTLFTDEYAPADAARFDGQVPLTHFPPLYPVAVATVASGGLSVESAARLLGAVLFAVNLMLIALLALALVPNAALRLVVVALAAIGPVAADPLGLPGKTWLFQHSQAMSEGLFTTFVLLTFLAIHRYGSASSGRSLLLIASPAALAVATRYSGIAVVLTAAGAVAASVAGPLIQRVLHGAIVAATAVAPTLLWEVGVSLTDHAPAARSVHSPTGGSPQLAAVFEGWLGTAAWSPALRHLVLAAVVTAVVVAIARNPTKMFRVIGAFVVLYGVVIVLTRAVLDASTPTDARMFLPVQGPFYVLVIGAIGSALVPALARRRVAAPAMRAVGIGVPIALLLAALPDAWRLVGDGLPSRPSVAATVAASASLPRGVLIATNVPTQLWQSNRRSSILVPLRITTSTDAVNASFRDEVRELADVVCRERGYIVLLGPAAGGFGTIRQANEDDFSSFPTLRVIQRLDDGVILGAWSDTCP